MKAPSLVRQLVRDHVVVVFLTCSFLVAATMAASAWILRRDQDEYLRATSLGLCHAITARRSAGEGPDLAAHVALREAAAEGRRFELLERGTLHDAAGDLPGWGDSGTAPPASPGCQSIPARGPEGETNFRACTLDCIDSYRVRVIAADVLYQSLARRAALGVLAALPLAALVGAVAGAARFRSRLRPLEDLRRAASHLEAEPGLALGVGARPAELASLERAIDGLLARVGDALAREKRFTQEASHELRTPLTLLRVRIEHLTQHLADRPALGGEAQEALRDVESLDRLVEALLLLARSESAGLPSTPVNLCDIAREAAARQIRALGKDGWTLEVTAPDEILVRGSEELLARAVSNLIENARKFGGDRPRVRVRVLEESGRGVIAVDDDGPGILPELRPLVFERFVRGPAERNRVPGVGLGLAVVRAVAERHGGDVSAGAGPLGGEEIRISIPLLRAAEPAAALG